MTLAVTIGLARLAFGAARAEGAAAVHIGLIAVADSVCMTRRRREIRRCAEIQHDATIEGTGVSPTTAS